VTPITKSPCWHFSPFSLWAPLYQTLFLSRFAQKTQRILPSLAPHLKPLYHTVTYTYYLKHHNIRLLLPKLTDHHSTNPKSRWLKYKPMLIDYTWLYMTSYLVNRSLRTPNTLFSFCIRPLIHNSFTLNTKNNAIMSVTMKSLESET